MNAVCLYVAAFVIAMIGEAFLVANHGSMAFCVIGGFLTGFALFIARLSGITRKRDGA